MAVSRSAVARELGNELRALRTARGFSLRDLEGEVGVKNSTISMWETGQRLPSVESLIVLLGALDAPDVQHERLVALLRGTRGPGHLETGVPSGNDQLGQLLAYERTATRITDMSPLLIPGLLQTSDYSRAIFGDDKSATLRAGRREILTRKNPVEYIALIDSEAILRPIASDEVMRDQMDHLLTLGELPNVHIHVWSSMSRDWHPGLTGPFMLLEFAAAVPIVHLEHHRSSLFLWEPDDVRGYMDAADKVRREVAMTPEESARVIADIAHGMEAT